MGELRDRFLADGRTDTAGDRFAAAVEFVRQKHPQMTVGSLATFLAIATRNRESLPTTATHLAAHLGLPVTTIFRQCDQLSDGVRGASGMNLLMKKKREKDSRENSLSVSIDGLALITGILELIDPDEDR